jgi:hypothetical protein
MHCSNLKRKILEVVASYLHYVQITKGLRQENVALRFKNYMIEDVGILLFRDKLYVPNTHDLRNMVLKFQKTVHNLPNPLITDVQKKGKILRRYPQYIQTRR